MDPPTPEKEVPSDTHAPQEVPSGTHAPQEVPSDTHALKLVSIHELISHHLLQEQRGTHLGASTVYIHVYVVTILTVWEVVIETTDHTDTTWLGRKPGQSPLWIELTELH